jgi:hypothetical protein
MTTSKGNGIVSASSLGGHQLHVTFTGRYAYWRPEMLLSI